jgi:hypothetical protein
LTRLFEEKFVPEITAFSAAWLVPFGPVPAAALIQLTKSGLIKSERVLGGINHPSGTQWNRQNCQLNTTADHSSCARNVGCNGLRTRSAELEARVAELLTLRP